MDLTKIQERLDALENSNKGSKSNKKAIWRPEEGSQVIRIVPYVHDRDWPFLELLFYYDLAKRTIISPQVFNNPDPVQEFCDAMKNTGETEDWKLACSIEPKLRTYVPVLVRGQEDQGVKFWGFGKTVYTELLKAIKDPDYGDITDLKKGTDITVEYVKPADGYPETTIRLKRNSTPATDSKEVLAFIKGMSQVSEIWPEPSYDELKTILETFLANKESDGGDLLSPPKVTAKEKQVVANGKADFDDLPFETETQPPAPSKQKAAVKSIDDAFDDMFN